MVGRSTTANGILSVARRFVSRSDSGEDGVENCSHCSGLEAREVLFKLSTYLFTIGFLFFFSCKNILIITVYTH